MGAGGQVSPCNGFFRELAEYTNCLPDGGGLDQMSWDKKTPFGECVSQGRTFWCAFGVLKKTCHQQHCLMGAGTSQPYNVHY